MRGPGFVHLRSRSPYSMLEGALKIKETAARCRKWRMPALALTDTNNMCGALEFSEIMKGEGVQPIIGLTLSLDLELDMQPGQIRKDPDGTIALLAKDEIGYENLMVLSVCGISGCGPDGPARMSKRRGWVNARQALSP